MIQWLRELFCVHYFQWKDVHFQKEITPTSICECGGWKMFHTNEKRAGDCGNFRLCVDKHVICDYCGKHDVRMEIGYRVGRMMQ